MKDYYNVFGLQYRASYRKVYRAFMNTAVPLHFNSNRDEAALQRFLELSEAFYVLEYKDYKRAYNKILRTYLKSGENVITKDDRRLLERWTKAGREEGMEYWRMNNKEFRRRIRKPYNLLDFVLDVIWHY